MHFTFLLMHLPRGWSGPTSYFSNYQKYPCPFPYSLSQHSHTDKDSKTITQSLSHFWASRGSFTLNGECWEDSARMWSKYAGVLIWKTKNPGNGLSLRGQFYDHLLSQTKQQVSMAGAVLQNQSMSSWIWQWLHIL